MDHYHYSKIKPFYKTFIARAIISKILLCKPFLIRPLALVTSCLLMQFMMSHSSAYAKSIIPDNIEQIEFQPLQPTKQQVRTSVSVLDKLSYQHFRKIKIDNKLSSMMLDGYIKDLDPSKMYFLASDIKEFEQYRFELDNALKTGNLKPGFTIFNRYQSRLIERFTFLIAYIEAEFDAINFNKKESLETDREHAPWAKRPLELDEIWRKRLKAAALSLLLTDKPKKEIKALLIKRYRSKLNRVLQNKSADAFHAYINSLTQVFDPHTQYFSPRNSENFNINMSLSLEGIGAVLQNEDEYTKVVRLVPAGPADKSGLLLPADKIVGVAQGDKEIIDVVGWRIDEVVELIRGRKGTEVRLEIISSKNSDSSMDTQTISIIRDKVKLEEQAAQQQIIEIKREDGIHKIGSIDIPAFYLDFKAVSERDPNYRSTTRDVSKLIKELKKERIEGLIIDLRDNGGGSLQEATTLLGLFVKTGPTVQIKDDKGRIELMDDRDPLLLYRGPLIVLVNRLSASASEIFAGAIQDYERGLIVGSQTFGKGTIQALRSLNKGQLKITQAKFYRISGESNQHQGIIPDIKFPSFYDQSEIGESAFDNALPWNRIRPVRYSKVQNLQRYVPTLSRQHQIRIQKDPDFEHLLSQIELSQSLKEKTNISLNKDERVKERKDREALRLSLENKRRIAKGETPLKNLEELDNDASKALTSNLEKQKQEKEPDPLLQESAHLLADLINLTKNRSTQTHSKRVAQEP